MAKQISDELKFHYDEELFNNKWASEVDPTSLVLLESGAVVEDTEIANMIAGGSNLYTIPFYKDLEGETQDYDGKTDVVSDDTEDGVQTGFVYGEMKGFKDTVFVRDFTGANPMDNIIARISKYWDKRKQKRLLAVLQGIFNITGDTEWDKHTTNIAATGDSVNDSNRMGLTTLREASVKALGEHADNLSLAIMHSTVALRLSNLQVLNFFEYQKDGMTYDVQVARSGNLLVLVWDGVPVKTSTTATGENEYTTYILGLGSILTADAPVEHPSDLVYDAKKNGGQEELITRMRKTYHPNGFSFDMSKASNKITPTIEDTEIENIWKREMKAENINIVRVITN